MNWSHGTRRRGTSGEPTLSGVTFSVPAGGFRWLLGPSGAGKSSLLRLLHLESLPRAGELTILGTQVSPVPPRRAILSGLRRRIGMVHQHPRLMPGLSVADNVALPLRLIRTPESTVREEVGAILEWVGLSERAEALPGALSGGEQQRVAIARAVVPRPALILADEPTNAQEDTQALRIVGMLRELSTMGTTVIIASHNETLIRRFEAPALILSSGRLTEASGV
ncbi:ATP-binding cassette domain-containing protein [Acetobacter sp. AN02]|nr:ATP-binding cassette domain-containing protein [Acetobacter sp. AN02]MDG6094407.1 ATP-binding cassette domain-containing protein [Acetobacter sp. AN02]